MITSSRVMAENAKAGKGAHQRTDRRMNNAWQECTGKRVLVNNAGTGRADEYLSLIHI